MTIQDTSDISNYHISTVAKHSKDKIGWNHIIRGQRTLTHFHNFVSPSDLKKIALHILFSTLRKQLYPSCGADGKLIKNVSTGKQFIIINTLFLGPIFLDQVYLRNYLNHGCLQLGNILELISCIIILILNWHHKPIFV